MSNIDDDPGAPSDRVRADGSQPRNQLIAMYSLLAVASLFGVNFLADAYLEHNTTGVRSGHLETSVAEDALAAYRDEAHASLAGGEMPIDEAVAALADRGRAAFVQIRPAHDDSDAPRLGWATLPVAEGEAAPRATRAVFTLSPSEMPPEEDEVVETAPAAAAPVRPTRPAPEPVPAPE
jgi:hypothetical protein